MIILYIYVYIYIYIYIYMQSICGQQPFHSLRAHQHSSDQMKILKATLACGYPPQSTECST